MKSIKNPHRKPHLLSTLLSLFALMLLMATQASADVNVLIIGSKYDGSTKFGGQSKPFDPTAIASELKKILEGAGLGTVNVAVQERYATADDGFGSTYSYSLASWYHWPYPKDVETTRWQYLRGESGTAGTDWNYVVLLDDPFTMEKLPGHYAQGVEMVAQEVAKGGAETILLMPWPASGNTQSSVAHYKEVVYRAGRTGGYKVAPAALAWQADGSNTSNTAHPSPRGAFICAASIYSTIWGNSASASSYVYNDTLADAVHTNTTTNNNTAQQYTGYKMNFQNPWLMLGDKRRDVHYSERGSSTEQRYKENAAEVISAARVNYNHSSYCSTGTVNDKYNSNTPLDDGLGWPTQFSMPIAWNHGRDPDLDPGKSYVVNPEYWQLAFDFDFHKKSSTYTVDDANDIELARIYSGEVSQTQGLGSEGTSVRNLAWRQVWAQYLQKYPTTRSVIDEQYHLHGDGYAGGGAFLYTLYSGRCGLTPGGESTTEGYAKMLGYQTAWRLGTGSTRAPGFKVMPSASSALKVTPSTTETMSVQFLFPPKNDVTVTISSSDTSAAIVGPQKLVFTPTNYNVAQSVKVAGVTGSTASAPFTIDYTTSSTDPAYDGLPDSWAYTCERTPTTVTQVNRGTTPYITLKNNAVSINLNAAGANDSNTTFAGAIKGTLSWSGSNVIYTPNTDYIGPDGFAFASLNGGTLTRGYIEIDVVNAYPDGSVRAEVTDASAAEQGSDKGTITITRVGSTSSSLSVNFTTSGTATKGSDYNLSTNSPVTIPAGQSSVVVTLTPIDDNVFGEHVETATLTIAAGTGYTAITNPATISIADNDNTAPVVSAGPNQTVPLQGSTGPVQIILAATDPIQGFKTAVVGGNTTAGVPDTDWPAAESPPKAIDGNTSTKYLNWGTVGSGFYITPAAGATTLTGVRIYTANDAEARDPLTISIEGSNGGDLSQGSSWTLIQDNINLGIDALTTRKAAGPLVAVAASASYKSYRIIVKSMRGSDSSVQYSELQLHGYTGSPTIVNLNGSATDAENDPLTTTWSVFGKDPSTAANPGFGNASKPVTSAVFKDAGIYTLRLSAYDGYITKTSDVTITVGTVSPTYSVTYNANTATGGTVPVDATSYNANATVTVLGNTGNLVKSGYTFSGWNTAANGSGTNYSAGSTFSITGNVTLYAKWTAATYSVTYNANTATGGTVPVDATSYTANATVTVLGNTGNLVKTGYTFSGWNTAANGSGTNYSAGSTFSITSNVTLYAKWTASSYTVTYNANTATGGTVPVDATSYNANATVTVLGNTGNLVKSGYTFSGWNTAANGSGTSYSAGNTFTISSNITLYAKWTAIPTYALTVTSGSGDGTYASGAQVSITADAPASGYRFVNWTSSGGGSFANANSSTTTFTMPANAATVTANYALNKTPVVSAGPDQTVSLQGVAGPAQMILAATDPIQGIKNTAVGGNSTAGVPGTDWPTSPNDESPPKAIDGSTGTKYLNKVTIGSGFYITPAAGATTLTGVKIYTANDASGRDPLTISIEGANGGDLTQGSSWTLIQDNINLGINVDPGRLKAGPLVSLTASASYKSYRIIVKSQRGTDAAVQYSEMQLFGSTGGTGATVNLNGTATDADGDSLTTTWSVVSKDPSTAANPTFANAAQPITTAAFTEEGTYTLRLSANDGYVTVNDEVTIKVGPPLPAKYATWAGGTFAKPFTDTALTSNPDGDSMSNLMEFAYGTDPTLSSEGTLAIDGSKNGSPTPIKNGGNFDYYFVRRKDHGTSGSVSYTAQFSSNLTSFTNSTDTPIWVADCASDPTRYEVVKVPFPNGTKFGRLEIVEVP